MGKEPPEGCDDDDENTDLTEYSEAVIATPLA